MDVGVSSSLSLLDGNPRKQGLSPRRHSSSAGGTANARTGVVGAGTFAERHASPFSVNGDFYTADYTSGSPGDDGSGDRVQRESCLSRFWRRWLWAIVAAVACVTWCTVGVVLICVPYSPYVGRFFLAAGLYGLAGGVSNFVAVRFLLHKVFIARNEKAFKRSIRAIVMDVFFDRDTIEDELVESVRSAASSFSVKRNLQSMLEAPAFDKAVDRRLAHLESGPEGMMLALLGVPVTSLKPLVTPLALSLASDLLPTIEQSFAPENIITADRLSDALHRVVTRRIDSFSLGEVGGVLRSVLMPHLSVMILFGSLFGCCVGVVTEVVQVSRFMHSSS